MVSWNHGVCEKAIQLCYSEWTYAWRTAENSFHFLPWEVPGSTETPSGFQHLCATVSPTTLGKTFGNENIWSFIQANGSKIRYCASIQSVRSVGLFLPCTHVEIIYGAVWCSPCWDERGVIFPLLSLKPLCFCVSPLIAWCWAEKGNDEETFSPIAGFVLSNLFREVDAGVRVLGGKRHNSLAEERGDHAWDGHTCLKREPPLVL